MHLTPSEIALVRTSWSRAAAAPDLAGRLFYARLFALAPETRAMFPDDLHAQRRKLVDALGSVVATLDDARPLRDQAAALGRSHARYGATEAQYEAVGAALLWTLEHLIGPDFDAAARAAWEKVYARLAAEMIAAARAETRPGGAAETDR